MAARKNKSDNGKKEPSVMLETLNRPQKVTIDMLKNVEDGSQVTIVGYIAETKVVRTKKGYVVAFVILEDATGSFEVVMMEDVYEKAEALLDSPEPLIVSGVLDKDVRIVASKVSAWTEPATQLTDIASR